MRAGVRYAATAEETPPSMQEVCSGDGQSEMAGNSTEINPTWRTMMAKPEVSRKGMKELTHMEQGQTEL